MHPETSDKIQAISTLVATDQFYIYHEAFECIANVLNDKPPYFDVVTPLDGMEVAWALVSAKLNDDDFGSFSNEVLSYITVVLQQQDAPRVPEIIKKYVSLDYPDRTPDVLYESDINNYILAKLKKIKNEMAQLPWAKETS